MSGGSGSSQNVGRPLGVYFSPVNVKAPESLMNSERAAIPLGVPRSSGRASSRYSALSFVRQASYRSHVLMMCSHVCRSSPHSQSTLFSGKNCLPNSPVYACVSGATLDQVAEYLSPVLGFREMFGGVEG